MTHIVKIRRNKFDQLQQNRSGRVNPHETSFMLWVKQKIGYLDLMSKRKFYDPKNVFQWNLPVAGQLDDCDSMDADEWYALKFSEEILRADLARVDNIGGYDMWSFYAGVQGSYWFSVDLALEFEAQHVADFYAKTQGLCHLSINGNKLTEPIARCEGTSKVDTELYDLWWYLSGNQAIWLNAGDRVNVYINVIGAWSPALKQYTTWGHIAGNFLTDKTRRITAQYTGEKI